MNKWILWLLLALSLLLNAILFRGCSSDPIISTVHDTVLVEKERVVEKTKVEFVTTLDTVIVTLPNDTVYLQLPIEHKVYEDTFRTDTSEIDLKVRYSGFKPSLDEISITNHYWQKEPYKPKKYKLGQSAVIGLQVGYGVSLNGTFSPYIGLGLSYGLGVTW